MLQQLDIIHNQCVIISFHYEALQYVRKTSDYHTGWVLQKYDEQSHQQAKELHPDYLIINHRKLPENEKPWANDWHWMVYDITDPELALHYASFNIPLIETRNICSMLEHPVLALNTCEHDL